jgi:histidyl-tRNA synthetase
MITKPKLLKGFRDFRGDELRIRKRIFSIFSEVFESYGYEPLETPTLEYFELLMGKYGEEEKLVYQFTDHGDRRVAMKYDLTVPTSRVMAQYENELQLPWKRYQIQPVWRADNTQKGRFREFYQLDADIFGVKSTIADAEFIDMGIDIVKKLGFEKFIVRINNRKILNAVAKYAGREDKCFDIIYAIDKWDKRTPEETREDLIKRLADPKYSDTELNSQVDKIFECVVLQGTNAEKLDYLSQKFKGINEGEEGVAELQQILKFMINKDYFVYDPTIARGLAYYTGPVWEFQVIEGGVGSIAGCGRYDKLVSQFLGREIPATGGSFGIERIIEVMKDRGMLGKFLAQDRKTILVALDEDTLYHTYQLANQLRLDGIKVMLFPVIQKLGKTIEYALKLKYSNMVIIGENEIRDGLFTIKNLEDKSQFTLGYDEMLEKLR